MPQYENIDRFCGTKIIKRISLSKDLETMLV